MAPSNLSVEADLNRAAQQVAHHYGAYILGLSGAFARILDGRSASSPASKNAIERAGQSLLGALMGAVEETLTPIIEDLQNLALKGANPNLDAEAKVKALELGTNAGKDLIARIQNVATNDLNNVLRAWRRFAFDVENKVNAGVGRYGAELVLRQGRVAQVEFKQVDKAGRRWDSALYVRTATRGALLDIYVETYLYGVAALPQDLAKVVYEDPQHDHNGMVFSIMGATKGYPTFESIRADIFHPNSTALVSQA